MKPNVWYRILPHDEDNDDISYSCGQTWDRILPLLINTKLFSAKVVKYMINITINRYSWESFCKKIRTTSSAIPTA